MKKRWIHGIQIALLLVIISGLITGCAGLSSVSAPQKTIATVTNMWANFGDSGFPYYRGGNFLFVELKPTDSTLADKAYEVDLYENGNLRASTSIAWNQPEINVSSTKLVQFPITEEEYNAYYQKDVSHIFSAKVHE
jgi:hypothetical protein